MRLVFRVFFCRFRRRDGCADNRWWHVASRQCGTFGGGPVIDKEKTYRTRDWRKVRIYATDHSGTFPIVGAIFTDAQWLATSWTSEGTWSSAHSEGKSDLIEVKPRIVRDYGWCNVYPSCLAAGHETKEIADAHACLGRTACVLLTIDCEHGEGL